MTNKSIRDYINLIENLQREEVSEESDKQFAQRMKKQAEQPPTKGMSQKEKEDKGWAKPKEKGVAEGLGKDIKRLATGKDVKSRAGQEIAKSQDASMKGDIKTSKKHFDRYDKLDKLANKEQGVAEGSLEEIDRRGFLKGLGAAAVAGAAGSATGKENTNDRLDSSDEYVYIWWYCQSLQNWLTPEQQAELKKFKAPSINSDDRIREKAYRDSAMWVTRAKDEQSIAKRANAAFNKLRSVKQGVAEEQLEETSPEAIAKINQITRR